VITKALEPCVRYPKQHVRYLHFVSKCSSPLWITVSVVRVSPGKRLLIISDGANGELQDRWLSKSSYRAKMASGKVNRNYLISKPLLHESRHSDVGNLPSQIIYTVKVTSQPKTSFPALIAKHCYFVCHNQCLIIAMNTISRIRFPFLTLAQSSSCLLFPDSRGTVELNCPNVTFGT